MGEICGDTKTFVAQVARIELKVGMPTIIYFLHLNPTYLSQIFLLTSYRHPNLPLSPLDLFFIPTTFSTQWSTTDSFYYLSTSTL